MGETGLTVRGSSKLRRARAQVDWVGDDELDELEDREPYAAGAMSIALPGSGHIYNRNFLRGFGILAASIAAVAFVPYGVIPYLAAGAVSSVLAFRQSRDVNRYVKARWREQQHPEHEVKATRLLERMSRPGQKGSAELDKAAPPSAASGQNRPLVTALRKLATLHRNGMITDIEYDDRKTDAITEAATALSRPQLDDLLFDLLPLRNEGSLEDGDIEFIKTLSP